MSAGSAAARGRMAAEREMTLTLTAYSPNGYTTVGGFEVPAYTNRGTTPGKVQARTAGLGNGSDASGRKVRVGDVDQVVLEGGLHIPISALVPVAGEYGIGWEYVVTAVGDADPALLNRRFLVTSAPVKSYATARRLDIAEVPT